VSALNRAFIHALGDYVHNDEVNFFVASEKSALLRVTGQAVASYYAGPDASDPRRGALRTNTIKRDRSRTAHSLSREREARLNATSPV
jgi:hypothetical protein